MGLMLSVLVMCVGVLEAISSVQHITESFLPLDTTRKKRRMVVDSGTGNIRHADIGWPGDVPRGLHVIKKRSGLTSPHSSIDLPDDDHSIRRCSEHFDSAQLERAVSAILLEEDMSSDETSEEVTQILSGVVQSCIEFPTEHSRVPQKSFSPPEPGLHDTFAPINEPRHDAERVPEKEPLLATEAVEADLVDLKPTERLIKYFSAETGVDEYDSSESSEKHSRENRSISKSETSVSYGSELPSSSLSSDILADEDRKSKPLEVLGVYEVEDIPIKDHKSLTDDDTDSNETISDLIESQNHDAIVLDDSINSCPLPQSSVPETQQHSIKSDIHRSLSEDQVPVTIQNDDDRLKPNEPETFTHRESIVELIESTNNIVFSDETQPTLQRSESIVELIQSTNSLVFVPETKSQEDEVKAILVERQRSIEELIKSTNGVILCREVLNNQELRSTSDTPESDVVDFEKSLSDEVDVLSELTERRVANDVKVDEICSTGTVVRVNDNDRPNLSQQSSDETAPSSAVCGDDFDGTLPDLLQKVEETHIESVETGDRIPSSSNTSAAEHESVPTFEETFPVQETKLVTEISQKVLDSSAEVDSNKSKPVMHPILTPSSSEEDDSGNSVTTIITECVQTIVDIGPPAEKTDTENQLGTVHEIPCYVPETQAQDIGNILASCNKLEELASAIDDELGSHDLRTNIEDVVISSETSRDSERDNVDSEIPTETDRSIDDQLEQIEEQDSGFNQKPTLSDELEFPEQAQTVIDKCESDSEKPLQLFDCGEMNTEISLQILPNNATANENDSCLIQESLSQLEAIGGENFQTEIVESTSDTCNVPTCLEDDNAVVLDATVVLGVTDQEKAILAPVVSGNSETTSDVAHTLPKAAEDLTELALVEEVVGDHNERSTEPSRDLLNSISLDNSTDSETKIKAELETSSLESAREVDECEKIPSETPQPLLVDSPPSKTQNEELLNTGKGADDLGVHKTNNSENGFIDNKVSTSNEVVESGKSVKLTNSSVKTEMVPSTVSTVPFESSSPVYEPPTQKVVEALKSTTDAVPASTVEKIIMVEEERVENNKMVRREGDLKMDSQIRNSPTRDEPKPPSKSSESIPTNSGENVHHRDKTRQTGEDRTTESATDLRPTASEVRQEVRRVSSIDEGDVINVTPSQNRPADMENVQEAPSTSPDKAFWVRD